MASTVLIFLGFSQAELQSVQALGLHVTFGRPEAVVLGLVAVTFYFAYRYLLYLIQEPGPGLKGEFFRRLNEYSEPKIRSLRDSQYPEGKGLQLEERLGVRSKGFLSWLIMVPSAQDNTGGFETGELIIHLRQVMPESIKAALLACLTRSYFTDYFFPFLLAATGFGSIVWDSFIRQA
ncbi:hypothetical protein [Halomonas nitroreducens]|uniref:Uncharacterized protein n=1 Tax=Halomonas nitroreducens TaxID=447425 RepID=A0A3S0HPB7_9GAMM|nr:hypothetical protein [Halomonas nitroreducens]RTR02470.1 hypothetical protein EKG36_12815 [Halomonas nitroreducens]